MRVRYPSELNCIICYPRMVKDFDDVNERGKGFFGLHVERVYGSVYRAVLMTDLLQVES